MNYETKFNRALMSSLAMNKVSVQNINSGAFRKATVQFSFSQDDTKLFFEISATRTSNKLEYFGLKPDLVFSISQNNSSYSSGVVLDINDFSFIDSSSLKYIEMATVISEKESEQILKDYKKMIQTYAQQMI